MNTETDSESIVRQRLEELEPVPARNPQAASRARARFLAQAVSASELERQKGWKSIFRKERFAMNMLVSVLVIAGLLFGGGATVNAARDDLPNQPLYALKSWSEDLGLAFQPDPQSKVDRLMDLAQVRVQEMRRLVEAGESLPERAKRRLEQHIQQAVQTCLVLDDPTLDRSLLQIRDRLREQDHDLDRLQLHLQDQLQLQTQEQARRQIQEQIQILAQTRTALRERLRLVEEGLLDHEMFRERVRNGFHFGPDVEITPPVQNGQPTLIPGGLLPGTPGPEPGGPNPNPGGPNPEPGGPGPQPGGPNPEPGAPSPEPGGPNPEPGGPNPDAGSPNPDAGGPNPGGPNTDTGGPGPGGNGP